MAGVLLVVDEVVLIVVVVVVLVLLVENSGSSGVYETIFGLCTPRYLYLVSALYSRPPAKNVLPAALVGLICVIGRMY